jgi:hypothetical protein
VATSSGEAVVVCEIDATTTARALSEDLQLPLACTVLARNGRVVLTSRGETVAELTDPPMIERLALCMRRENEYQAILRLHEGRLLADIAGG